MSFFINLYSRVNPIRQSIFPQITLDPEKSYEIACIRVSFQNNILYVPETQNSIIYFDHFNNGKYEIKIEPNFYKVRSLVKAINDKIPLQRLSFSFPKNSDKVEISVRNITILPGHENSILHYFGFNSDYLSGSYDGVPRSNDMQPEEEKKFVDKTIANLILATDLFPLGQLTEYAPDYMRNIGCGEYFLTTNLIGHSHMNNHMRRVITSFVPREKEFGSTYSHTPQTPVYLPLAGTFQVGHHIKDIIVELCNEEEKTIDLKNQFFSVCFHVREKEN